MYFYLWHCFRCYTDIFVEFIFSLGFETDLQIYQFYYLALSLQIPQEERDSDWREASTIKTGVSVCLWEIWVECHITLKIYFLKRKTKKCLNPSEMKGLFFFHLQSSGYRPSPRDNKGKELFRPWLCKTNHMCLFLPPIANYYLQTYL